MKRILLILLSILSVIPAFAQQKDTTENVIPEVVVTGSKNAVDIRQVPFTVDVLTRGRLVREHRVNALATVSEQVPGLFVTSRALMGYGVSNGAAGGISIRGLSGSAGRMMVLIDGHPQFSGIYGHPISDACQTVNVERIEVLRGPASMLYGSNAMGGVINIVTRGMREEGMKTSINLSAGSYGTVQGDAGSSFRSGRISGNVSAQYGRTDNHRPDMGFEQYGGHAKLGYEIDNHWNSYFDADLTHFNASYPGSTFSPLLDADQWITRGNVSAGVENHFARTSGGISIYSNFGRHKINDGYAADGGVPQTRLFRSEDALSGISAYQSVSLFEGSLVTAGIDWQYVYGHAYYTSIATGEVLDTPNKLSGEAKMNEIAGYVDYRQEISELFTLDAGVRLDHHSVTGLEWIPQAGIVFRPVASGELKAMAGKGFRNPTMREMYLYPSSTEDLKPERIMNYELSWKQRPLGGAFNYGINVYYLKGDNLIQTVNRKNVNTGKVENCGAELEAAWRISGQWEINTNHSFLHMKYHILSAPQYVGYLGARYAAGKWAAKAGVQQVCGLFTSVGSSETAESFTLLDATLDYNLSRNLTIWLRGENLLNQKYEIILGYPMPGASFLAGISIGI